jgi:hypothetical protein
MALQSLSTILQSGRRLEIRNEACHVLHPQSGQADDRASLDWASVDSRVLANSLIILAEKLSNPGNDSN